MEVATKWMCQNQSELVNSPDNGFADMYMKIPLGNYCNRVVDACFEKVLYWVELRQNSSIHVPSAMYHRSARQGRDGIHAGSIHASSSANFTH